MGPRGTEGWVQGGDEGQEELFLGTWGPETVMGLGSEAWQSVSRLKRVWEMRGGRGAVGSL